MTTSLLVKSIEKMEIATFKRPKDIRRLKQTHVGFTGSPRQHPYDNKKVVLLIDPYKNNTAYYEFKTEDIGFLEELPNIVNMNDEVVAVVRIWVRKSSVGLRCSPFWVEDWL